MIHWGGGDGDLKSVVDALASHGFARSEAVRWLGGGGGSSGFAL